ncbi:MAG: transporter family protein [Rhodospirillales bacterium]|nr:transporter family protein [Rhodospirillales bacterium]
MTAISLDGVTLSIGGRRILSDVTLAIEDGEFIGMLGPNGAGKTTLMRALLGLVPVSAGSIQVLGAPVHRGNQAIGYMPQVSSPISGFRLSGRNFVVSATNGQRWGLPWPGKADYRDADRALELVGATELARRPLAETSGGERQRLLLAQALLGQPRLLLLDEPLISLDPNRQHAVIDLARRVQKELGIAVLFSAHELNPLLGTLDRVLYLGNGHAALGSVDEVITGPVLSRLYGSAIEVVRLNGRIFVMSDQYEVERGDHRHDDAHGHARDHGHGHHHA